MINGGAVFKGLRMIFTFSKSAIENINYSLFSVPGGWLGTVNCCMKYQKK